MTKEEILKRHLDKNGVEITKRFVGYLYDAMQEYADQQTTSLKAEVESLQSQLATKNRLLDMEQNIHIDLLEKLAKAEADKVELLSINFWKRLNIFISNVQVNDMMSEEEKEMIIHIANKHGNNK